MIPTSSSANSLSNQIQIIIQQSNRNKINNLFTVTSDNTILFPSSNKFIVLLCQMRWFQTLFFKTSIFTLNFNCVINFSILKFMMPQQQQSSSYFSESPSEAQYQPFFSNSKPIKDKQSIEQALQKQMSEICLSGEFNNLVQSYQGLYKSLPNMLLGQRKVKMKMIKKLFLWMKKLCFQALEFSHQTLEMSFRIVIRYLDQVDESVSNLQLLGCASLSLSSKLIEDMIVEAQMYSESALNIFNSDDLENQQQIILEIIADIQQTHTFSKASIFFTSRISFEPYQLQFIDSSIRKCLDYLELLKCNPYYVMRTICHLAIRNSPLPSVQAFENMIKLNLDAFLSP